MGLTRVKSASGSRRHIARLASAILPTLAAMMPAASLHAQIVTDKTLGKPAATLSGPNFLIPASLGQTRGGNLFQSFGTFNLATGESATFTGPTTINNVIARVTGGAASNIDGQLSCTIPNANLYFINPAGVIFGLNSTLDVQGSFAVTTAPVLRLADGGSFNAVMPDQSVLSSAAPSAFGFLTPNPAPVSIQGLLQVPDGKTLSVVAGQINMPGGYVVAQGGRINLVGVASAGDVKLDPSAIDSLLDVSGLTNFADITLSGGAQVLADGQTGGGGRVVVRGGNLVMSDASAIKARTYGDSDGLGISVNADTVQLTGGSFITSGARGIGNAGSIDITANSVSIDGADINGARSGIFANTTATGNAGNVTINAGALSITNQGEIDVGSYSSGHGGNVNINAGSVLIDSQGTDIFTGIFSESRGPDGAAGDSGNIQITANSMNLANFGVISTSNFASGAGGTISVNATNLSLDSGGIIKAETTGSGNSGTLNVQATNLTITNGASISADTLGDVINGTFNSGNAGNINIVAQTALLDAQGTSSFTGILSQSLQSSGHGGNISFTANNLTIQNGALISAETAAGGNGGSITVNVSGLLSIDAMGATAFTGIRCASTAGTGNGGDLLINAGTVNITNGGAEIAADAEDIGNAGNLTLNATALNITTGGKLTVAAGGIGNGGTLMVNASQISLDGTGAPIATGIFAQAPIGSTGNAGHIVVDAGQIAIRNGALISSSNDGFSTLGGTGQAGTVSILAQGLLIDGQFSQVTASTSGSGAGGSVNVNVVNLTVSNAGQITTETSGGGAGGTVNVTANNLAVQGAGSSIGAVASSTGAAGNVTVNAPVLTLSNGGLITAETDGVGAGGTVNVTAGQLAVQGMGSSIGAISKSTGAAGNVTVNAANLNVAGGGAISAETDGAGPGGTVNVTAANQLAVQGTGSSIGAIAKSSGPAGNVTINAAYLAVVSGGVVSAETAGAGAGGTVNVGASVIAVDGTGSSIGAIAKLSGPAGNVVVHATNLALSNGGAITAETDGSGDGGTVNVTVNQLVVQGIGSNIGATAKSSGDAGNVNVNAPNLIVANAGEISAETDGSGAGGTVNVTANHLAVQGTGSSIGAVTTNDGPGGNVIVNAADAQLSNGGTYSAVAAAGGPSGNIHASGNVLDLRTGAALTAAASGTGAGGNIVVDSNMVHVSSSASVTSAATGMGNAGTVSILAGKRFTLDSLGSVTTQSALSNGGDITINAKRGVAVVNSLITATAAADAGSISVASPGTLDIAGARIVTEAGHNGGNITLTPELATLNRVRISANAGNNGGNIRIRPQALLATPDTRITATGTRGVSGQIEVTSPDQTIASSVARLPTSLYDAGLTLQPQCGQMTGMMNVSSFVVSGRGGVPLGPGTWQMDFDVLRLSSPTTEASRKRWPAGPMR